MAIWENPGETRNIAGDAVSQLAWEHLVIQTVCAALLKLLPPNPTPEQVNPWMGIRNSNSVFMQCWLKLTKLGSLFKQASTNSFSGLL